MRGGYTLEMAESPSSKVSAVYKTQCFSRVVLERLFPRLIAPYQRLMRFFSGDSGHSKDKIDRTAKAGFTKAEKKWSPKERDKSVKKKDRLRRKSTATLLRCIRLLLRMTQRTLHESNAFRTPQRDGPMASLRGSFHASKGRAGLYLGLPVRKEGRLGRQEG